MINQQDSIIFLGKNLTDCNNGPNLPFLPLPSSFVRFFPWVLEYWRLVGLSGSLSGWLGSSDLGEWLHVDLGQWLGPDLNLKDL